MTAKRLTLIGAPVEAGATTRGCVMGPTALRIAGLSRQLTDLGHHLDDQGDLGPQPVRGELHAPANTRNWAEVLAWSRPISDSVFQSLSADACPIVLGGDHSLSIGAVNGAARYAKAASRPLTVLWLDAHADFNTPETSPSGNLHGMSVAAFCGDPALERLYSDDTRAPVPATNVHIFGTRSVDPDERRRLRDFGVDVVDMRRIDEQGVVAPLSGILASVAERNSHLHVSFDVDFLDPSVGPAVGTTVPGGATYREAHLVMEMLHDSCLVTSVDVAELNPFLDERGRTALVMADLLASLFGRQVFDRPTAPHSAA